MSDQQPPPPTGPPHGPPHGPPEMPPRTAPPQWPAPPAPVPVAPPPAPAGWFRRGFGLGAGASLGVWLVLGVLGGITSLVLGVIGVGLLGTLVATSSDAPVTSTVWGDANAEARLMSVQVNGVILGDASDGTLFGGGTYGYELADVIDSIDAGDADGLVLEMNTPGGTIYGSRAIADAVERYQERTGNQVMAYVRGVSASGGMFAMAGADQIVADRGTLVGSIGIISGPFERYRDVTALQGSLLTPGVETQGGITSEYLTQGRGKDFGNPYRDMTEEERAVWTAGLENEYADFVGWVSQHRGIDEAVIRDDLGAFLYDASTAVDNGLVDSVMGQDDAFRFAAEMNDLDPGDTRVDRVETGGLFGALLGAQAPERAGAPEAGDPATSVVCSGPPVVLALHGDLTAACGF